MLRGVNRPHF